ncbi:aminotransferase class III-fold pyridoxal phosphate-dependent enzyme [Patulibacter americanus]|uniref:aminotransferase class III-fold pyridoxal phosphate-dependent enzyme n=1 Tax=Patulibacter americanus TaxID=588672 RepID=UPI0003B78FB6|nr:aminotransferase class III-fold pyridoxal phosphate-dependent enzyme [Patulibacter americanus]
MTTTPLATTVGANDSELRLRAQRVVPGGMYGHLNARHMPEGYPQFFARGEGCRIWDVDGREYLDFMCSWGPILLGHAHPVVDAAATAAMATGDVLNGPTPHMVELAELLVDQVPHADWTMFAKNGNDVTTLGVVVARAATGHRKVLVANNSYHGIAGWSSRPGVSGMTPEDHANTVFFDYNDLASVEAAVAEAGEDDVAAIVVTPIRHDVFRDLEPADPEFARGVRAVCDRVGAALIVDDVRCGLRLDLRGSWEALGVRADLSAWSKSLANGHPLAVLLGAEAFREAASGVTATGSFWMAGAPMAAAVATINVLRETDGIGTMRDSGQRFQDGLAAQAAAHGLQVTVSGPPQLPFLSFAGDATFERAKRWTGECAQNGVFLHPVHNWFLSAAHDAASIDAALERTDEAFATLRGVYGAD